MHKRILAAALVVLLVNLVCYAQGQAGPKTKEDEETDKVISAVFKIGLGTRALMKIVLRDGRELKGYITEANEETFVLHAAESRAAITLKYEQVKQAKKAKPAKPFQSRRRKVGSILGYVLFFGIIVANIIGYARK